MMEWQPIETAPKDGTHVTVSTNNKRIFHDWFFDCGEWGDEDDIAENYMFAGERLTHWIRIEAP